MSSPRVAPVQIRFPDKLLGALRKSAEKKGVSFHNEVVGRLETSVASEGEEPDILALKTLMASLADRFAWMIAPEGERPLKGLLRLYRAALLALFDELDELHGWGKDEPSEDLQMLGRAAAMRLLMDIAKAQEGDDLAAVASALGIQEGGLK